MGDNSKFLLIYFVLVALLGFTVVCHGCGRLLYEGKELIPLYRLRRRTDGKCPSCGRKLGVDPISIEFDIVKTES